MSRIGIDVFTATLRERVAKSPGPGGVVRRVASGGLAGGPVLQTEEGPSGPRPAPFPDHHTEAYREAGSSGAWSAELQRIADELARRHPELTEAP
jgi:hypothetical protein